MHSLAYIRTHKGKEKGNSVQKKRTHSFLLHWYIYIQMNLYIPACVINTCASFSMCTYPCMYMHLCVYAHASTYVPYLEQHITYSLPITLLEHA